MTRRVCTNWSKMHGNNACRLALLVVRLIRRLACAFSTTSAHNLIDDNTPALLRCLRHKDARAVHAPAALTVTKEGVVKPAASLRRQRRNRRASPLKKRAEQSQAHAWSLSSAQRKTVHATSTIFSIACVPRPILPSPLPLPPHAAPTLSLDIVTARF